MSDHRCLVLINRLDDPAQGDATLQLAAAAARLRPTMVADVASLAIQPDGSVGARGVLLRPDHPPLPQLRMVERQTATLGTGDVVLLRTNPARDPGRASLHRHVVLTCALLERQGVRVVNAAASLGLGWSKAFLAWLPAWTRPATLITADRATLLDWIAAQPGRVVVKPAAGTHGAGVFLVAHGDPANVQQICDAVLRDGPAVAQRWAPGARAGDVRVLTLDGAALSFDGRVAAVRRVPPEGGFRSNIHAGGRAEPATLNPRQRRVVATAAEALLAHGVVLAGIDLIGDLIVEVNVHAPGGFGDVGRFLGVDVAAHVAERLLGSAQVIGEAVGA